MTQNIKDLHVYLRSIRPDERTSLSVLSGLVHDGATVLDLGCGSGALGTYLRETRNCTVDGLTWSEAEAELARRAYRQVVVADLDAANLLELFAAQQYDYIICADVLEHLRGPDNVLRQCRDLLKPTGQLLFSVPNAGYAGLVAELMQGDFRYREEGLLDSTHLRFFTRKSLARFLGDNAWEIKAMDTIRREMPESEFKAQFDELPPAVSRYLLSPRDALTYQFIGSATPVAQPLSNEVVANAGEPPAEAHALFTTQLYVDRGDGYTEDGKLSATGVIGAERQTVRFGIPAGDRSVTHLRLDPADRPGFLYLYRMTLRDATGTSLWQWSSDAPTRPLLSQTPHQQIEWHFPHTLHGAASMLLLTGNDPWFELPVPLTDLPTTSELVLDLELGWPMSADYLVMANSVLPLQEQVADLTKESNHLRSSLGHRVEELSAALEISESQRTTFTDRAVQFEREAAKYEQNALRLHHELQDSRVELRRSQTEYNDLVTEFKTLEKSILYRATRPIAAAKRSLQQLRTKAPQTAMPVVPALSEPQRHVEPMTPGNEPVDVIVPVYRGLADTQLCVESVLAAPVQSAYRLIIINDCSPEPEVTEWLRERAKSEPRIMLLENEENLGFVGTVNRGMALSDANDVLLLNSDTEVANNWLDRIRASAYGDRKIASVTPFSTNATICSYPRFCEDNPLPPGYDTARMDALCAATNPGAVVDVPTGVGFCMYIRRDSLKEVGLFDTKNFGKGYGEENDYCQRAERAGWRNLHLLDTFVLHTGGVSFGASKSPREQAAMKTLARLHPHYSGDVYKFVLADPARPYRLALDVARIREARLPVVLNVLHDRAGGTVRHVRELGKHLADKAVFLILTPGPLETVILRMASAGEGFELSFRLEDQAADLLNVLRQLGVSHVHYHHLLGHGKEVRELPALLNVSFDFTAHDYYSYCKYITLTGEENHYQGEYRPGLCKCCAPEDPAPLEGNIARWRGANSRLVTAARHLFTPSEDTAQRMRGFAPAADVLAIPHTDIYQNTAPPLPAPQPLAHGRRLKIAVIGALSDIKGADVLEAVAQEAIKQKLPLEFHLFGYGYRELATQPRAALTVHGAYKESELNGLLEWLQPDLVWFPALWPETYSYTLSAALQAALPVAVPDIGAFAERVAGRPWSWICPWDQTAREWADLFMQMRDEHFASGNAPALEASQPEAPTVVAPPDWHYRRDYFTGMTDAAQPAADAPALTRALLASYKPVPLASDVAKSGAFRTLAYLRSLPLMRDVARRIPSKWQRKVGSWLKG